MELWIILSCLVGVVAILLIVSRVFDKKKTKRLKLKEDNLKHETLLAREKAIYFTFLIIEANEQALQNFVPSIGKMKMSDIRNNAKNCFKFLINSSEYKILKDSEEKDDQELVTKINELANLTSTSWDKSKLRTFFVEKAKNPTTSDDISEYQKEASSKIKEFYA